MFRPPDGPSLDERDEDRDHVQLERNEEREDLFSASSTEANAELQLLTAYPEPMVRNYGTESLGNSLGRANRPHRSFFSRFSPSRARRRTFMLQVGNMTEDAALHGLPSRNKIQVSQDSRDAVEESEGEYLKSKLW